MGADVGEPRLDLGNAVRVDRGLGLGEERGAFAMARQHDVDEAFRPVGRFLRQPPDGGAGRPKESAMLDGDVARNGAEQARLAGAVAADEPDPRAVGNLHRRPLDQKPAGHAQRNIVDHQHEAV